MGTFEEERERDFAAYEQLKDEIREKYLGQYVAIADGRLIKVAPNFQEAWEAAKSYRHRLVFQAGAEPPRKPVYIRWLVA